MKLSYVNLMAQGTRTARSGRSLWIVLTAVACLAGLGALALVRKGPSPFGEPAGEPSKAFLVISGDTHGWITPCGCASNQSGGLLRRGSYLKELRKKGVVVLADVGGAASGTSDYDRLKFEAILRGEMAMGLAVHNIGASEAALGADYLRWLASEKQVPFVSANARDKAGKRIAEPLRIVVAGERRIALAGVLARRFAAEDIYIDHPRDALLEALAAVEGKYDSLIVLAYLPEEELKQFAASLPEGDAVVGGPTGQVIPPQEVGPTLLASATNKGKFLLWLGIPGKGKAGWSGEVVQMEPELPDDADQMANLKVFHAEMAKRDFSPEQTAFAPQLPAELPEGYQIAGTDSCRKCHEDDCRLWDGSKHAEAWRTLEGRGHHVDPYCQQCHTTGYGLPGGFVSAMKSASRAAVGCESCHGPSLTHAQEPKQKTAFLARDQCVRCHDRENSPSFDYVAYWERVTHGTKVTMPAPATKDEAAASP